MAVSHTERKKTLTVQDHIATQGITVVAAALGFLMLHWCCPDYAARILAAWQNASAASPTVVQLWQTVTAWFA